MAKQKYGAWVTKHPKKSDGWAVGYTSKQPEGGYSDYHGPVARVSFDDTWLHIVTDSYEGHAMLNIETLPKLRKVLAQIARELRAVDAKAGIEHDGIGLSGAR